MTTRTIALRGCAAVLAAGCAAGVAAPASACAGSGVVTRIEGNPQDITILRTDPGQPPRAVTRPRVLEVVCQGDQVKAAGQSRMFISVDGVGKVKVDSAAPYTVARKGAPTVAGNAYRAMSDRVVPDMKRLPWDVRLKGGTTGFEFSLAALASGRQTITPGSRDLLVRLAGGSAPYVVELTPAGKAPIRVTSADSDVLLPRVGLTPGAYKLRAADGAANAVEAQFTVADQAPPAPGDLTGLPDAEVQVAARSLELAKAEPATWSFEAELQLAAAPKEGLDRARVYQLLESYYDNSAE